MFGLLSKWESLEVKDQAGGFEVANVAGYDNYKLRKV